MTANGTRDVPQSNFLTTGIPVIPQSNFLTTRTPVMSYSPTTENGTPDVPHSSFPTTGIPVIPQSSVLTPGYPSANTGYPTAIPGYSSANTGYPTAIPGYPSANTGYPTATPRYPPASTGYPTVTHPENGIPSFYETPRRPPLQTNYQPWSLGYNPFGTRTSLNSEVSLKRISLPIFSGLRKDWPEFKTVWKQLADNAYSNQAALASELKRSVKGEAKERINSVFFTKPEAYDIMWKKLEAYYDDTSASVQAALDDIIKLTQVQDRDYKGLVHMIDVVECAYSQLEEMKKVDVLTMRDVDFVSELLPVHSKIEWIRKYHNLSVEDKVHPFSHFMKFLETEREAVARLAEKQHLPPKRAKSIGRGRGQTHLGDGAGTPKSKKEFFQCAYPSHRKDTIKHKTQDCKEFQRLDIYGKGGKLDVLKQVNARLKCFGDHLRSKCPSTRLCSKCQSGDHHVLLCKAQKETQGESYAQGEIHISTNKTRLVPGDSLSLYPIIQADVSGNSKKATVTVFCDGDSDTTYITHDAAQRIKAKRLKNYSLDVTTMGNVQKTYDTAQYPFSLKTVKGKKVEIIAYGMDRITGPVSQLDMRTVAELFPEHDPESLQRKSSSVDVLLGCDYFGLHPKKEEARSGDHVSVMSGDLGICLQGTHAKLKEETTHDVNLVKTIHECRIKFNTLHVRLDCHEQFRPVVPLCTVKTEVPAEQVSRLGATNNARVDKKLSDHSDAFIHGEELGTETTPRCGGCRCGKCPTVGHTYSFREEQELKMIQDNLQYDENKQQWITSYPWLTDPTTLPDNYDIALATLKKTEHTLLKDEQWADTYKRQMEDIVARGVARKLSDQEKEEWNGPAFYICHLAVSNPRSQSTPVRIVFNSSQVCHGASLNSYLAKGPDGYMNSLLGILLRWREEQVALVGDIKKMFNSVLLRPLEQHCHRFLWRDLQTDRDPDVYVMERVNMGDSPAPAISTEAIYKTADLFREDSQEAAELLEKSSYVDDFIDSFPSKEDAVKTASEAEAMLAKGGFKIKCWQFSGEPFARKGEDLQLTDDSEVKSPKDPRDMLKGTEDNLRVLGVGWQPVKDTLVYKVSFNFSKKRKGIHTEADIEQSDLARSLPAVLTKRMVLGQVMKIYDPLGFVCHLR
ncbi:uncharacterized protein LOC5508489 [Nematostella vectensis]|uniref:uncharacterized protein LOC5508489 n=1 Tax=Nematostella vectensis TaxID=45351 RepID=UPI0020779351|nr:uncharacterized protein LOC5508489 [Nematostella vectensis]